MENQHDYSESTVVKNERYNSDSVVQTEHNVDSDLNFSQLLKQQNELLKLLVQQQQQEQFTLGIMVQQMWGKIPHPNSVLSDAGQFYNNYGPTLENIGRLSGSLGNWIRQLNYGTTERQTRDFPNSRDNKGPSIY